MHVRDVRAYEEIGTFEGLGLHGTFHEWKDGDRDRRDEQLGVRSSTTLRIGDRMWVKDDNGAVRELLGIAKRRQVTEDFLGSTDFTGHPEFSTYAGHMMLPDGRSLYLLNVAPKGGESYQVGIDAKSWLISRLSYDDADGQSISTLGDQRVTDGLLVPYVEVDSNGDTAYDVTAHMTSVHPDQSIPASVFAPLVSENVANEQPVSVTFEERDGLPVVPVEIGGATYHFLLDSGSQTDVIDQSLVQKFGLHPEGMLEVSGAKRTSSGGVVSMSGLSIGGVAMPMRIATVLDLSKMMRSGPVDGILGDPLFAAADVRIDPDAHTLTIAMPGTLPPRGAKLNVDTDRSLSDVDVRIDGDPTRVLFDTGDANELLVFQDFIASHEDLVNGASGDEAHGTGIGGSIAVRQIGVGDLAIGPYHLYHRRAVVVFAHTGAFADRNDGGNVGYGTLQNFSMTFSLQDHAIYLQPTSAFDNGRFRTGRRSRS